jgi:ATP-dependent RNA helicase DDX23/PRP28
LFLFFHHTKMPLDIEEILRQKKAADAAAAKPRFIPKAERERLAAEKAKKEEDEQKRKASEDAQKRREEEQKWAARSNGSSRHNDSTNGSSRVPTGPKAMNQENGRDRDGYRDQGRGRGRGREGRKGDKQAADKQSAEDIEATLLRSRYLGPQVNQQSNFSAKKKRMRTTEKKFNFEWDADEDTSRDNDPLYTRQVVNHNGSFAGVGGEFDDEAEERARKRARMIEQRDPENGKERAKGIMEDFFRARDKARQRADRTGLGKRWSEKSLEDMRERDWRIFKEDLESLQRVA